MNWIDLILKQLGVVSISVGYGGHLASAAARRVQSREEVLFIRGGAEGTTRSPVLVLDLQWSKQESMEGS